jgi:hypothetical protein
VLPSIEVQHVPFDGDTSRKSVTNTSSTGDTEEGSEVYEPPEILPDHIDDEVAPKTPNRAASYHEKLAVPTMPAVAFGQDQPAAYESNRRTMNWNAHSTKHKLYESQNPKPVVDDRMDVRRTLNHDNDKKRRKIESIIP